MKQRFQKLLQQAGVKEEVIHAKRVTGGSINEAYLVETKRQKFFIKYNEAAPNHFFTLEATGLQLIQSTNTIHVPDVICYSDEQDERFLVLEWVSGNKTQQTDTLLGERLASMHQNKGAQHGFSKSTFIGTLQQPNGFYDSWLEYYRDRRLLTQLQLGVKRNVISGKRREKLEQLLMQLDRWIPADIPPSYLHGDLWGGNWIVGKQGDPYLIDPSFLYGDRHFDLAFTEVFGGFSKSFYQAYEGTFPTKNYYRDCKLVYQLYYLLVHLNLFGEVYGPEVDIILSYYLGD
ncbi:MULTISPECIES: fructosamine kinase family protein [Clostridia]|uniref:fructosamine kinase family protein n=1 Tax=Clostridia TaxID=186801 RepID=UPI000EA2E269|nr:MULTISPECIES: fructosamine kinase family protein [Clostridia]NBJ71691.1 fructosamine kinase [Roseburia sp. 1XD42-34]RKI73785.1 fructosamine kinase [Clostridium sp. 1xD42-85]